jgi:NADPH-dependent glutamate synthase beta subunit-like oxidoreductase
VEFVRCISVFDASGIFSPSYDSCHTETIKADTVIIAAGQSPVTKPFEGLGIIKNGKIAHDEKTLETLEEGLFCAGDAANGPTSVVEAMASGRTAAESVHRYLMGEHMLYGRSYRGPFETEFEITTGNEIQSDRVAVPVRQFTAKGDFAEIEAGLDEDTARKEAGRCFACGQAFGEYRTCWFCLPCEIECPHKALRVEIPYLLR